MKKKTLILFGIMLIGFFVAITGNNNVYAATCPQCGKSTSFVLDSSDATYHRGHYKCSCGWYGSSNSVQQAHSPGRYWYGGGDYAHYQTCSVCGTRMNSGTCNLTLPCQTCGKSGVRCSICTSTKTHDCNTHTHSYTGSCSSCGTSSVVCSCGDVKSHTCETHSHLYYEKSRTEPTCTSSGSAYYECSCGDSFTTTISATGHSWGSWSTTSYPTCTSSGSKKRTCSTCGSTQTSSIAATGHSYGSWTTSSYATCTSNGSRYRTCSDCGDRDTETLYAYGHSYSSTVIKSPTCSSTGTRRYTCSSCGDTYTTSIDKTAHTTPSTWNHITSDKHHKLCTVCSTTLSSEAHYDNNGDGACDACGYVNDTVPPVASISAVNNKNSVTITGTATDDKGIVVYAWTTSDATPTTWTSINKTTSLTQTLEVTSSGNHYFWVRDAGALVDSKMVTVYEVAYNLNGGDTVPQNHYKVAGTSITLDAVKATRAGYTFLNWNTSADGSGTTYNPGDTYSADSNVTLYAQWKLNTFSSSLSQTEYTYNGVENTPIITVKDGDKTLTEGTDYTVTMTGDKKNVGTVSIIVKGINDYCWIEELKSYTIKHKDIADLTYEMSNEEYYNGLPRTPTLTIKYNSITLTKNTDYTIEYLNNTDIGTATVKAIGKGNYTGTKELAFEIVRDPESTDYIYLDLTAPTISNITVEIGNTLLLSASIQDPLLATGEPGSGVNASATRYMITEGNTKPTASDANWQASNEITQPDLPSVWVWIKAEDNVGNVSIEGKEVQLAKPLASSDITVSLSETEYTYDGTAKTPSVTVKDTTLNYDLVVNKDYTFEYQDNINAGTAKVVLKGMGDYGGTRIIEFTIKKAPSTITIEDTEMRANETIDVSYEYTGDSTIVNVTSSNEAIAKIGTIDIANKKFKILGIADGETTITINIPEGMNYQAQTATMKIKVIDDTIPPTVTFTPNGSTGYVTKASTKVVVSDNKIGVDESSLMYVWTQNTSEPNKSAFVNKFVSGQTIELTSSNGTWFLWILAKDNFENEIITRSEAFYLDSEAPIGSILINKRNNKWQNTNELTVNLLAEDNLTDLPKIKYALIEAENVQNIKSEDLVWNDYSEIAAITASNTEGKKTIFVIFKDEAGNISLSVN